MAKIEKATSYIVARIRIILMLALTITFAYIVVLQLRREIEIPESIDLKFLEIQTYGLVVIIAIWIYLAVLSKILPKPLEAMNLFDAMLWIALPTLVGARLWHIATDYDLYQGDLGKMVDVSSGGTALWGALVGAFIGIWIYTLFHGFKFRLTINYAAAIFPLAQSIGRFANFFKQELYGEPTQAKWGMYVREENRPKEFASSEYFHPTPVYESLLVLVLFLLLVLALIKIKRHNYKLLEDTYIMPALWGLGYSMIRFFVEFYRREEDVAGNLTLNQLVAIGLFVISASYLGLLLGKYFRVKSKGSK